MRCAAGTCRRTKSRVKPNEAQEDEANALAFKWFNAYLETKSAKGLTLYTLYELEAAQAETKAQMLAAQRS